MDVDLKKELEYEEQLFQYSSRFFVDSFKTFLKEELETTVESLVGNIKKKLLKDSKNPDEFNAKLDEMKNVLTVEYQNSSEAAFEANKIDIAKYMSIPKNVLLEEDLPVKIGAAVDPQEIDREIAELKNQRKVQKYIKEKILEEMDQADSTIFLMEKFLDDKEIKFDVLPEGAVKNLTELANENFSMLS